MIKTDKNMKKTALVTGGSTNDTAAIACLVINIKETNPNLADEIVILHDGIRKKDQKIMRSIFNVRFIKYESPFKNDGDFEKHTIEYFSKMVFCKYECLRLLDEYKTVIWTDYDVVFTSDVSELAQKNNFDLKLVENNDTLLEQFLPNFDPKTLPNVDFTKKGIALPLTVFFDSLQNPKEIYDACIAYTKKFSQFLQLPEQAGFQLAIQDFNTKYETLDLDTYVLHPKEIEKNKNAKILHAYCQPKFWNGLHNDDWERYYAMWRRLGGCKHEARYNKFDWFCYKVRRKLKKIFF